jgi:hypothetical protein
VAQATLSHPGRVSNFQKRIFFLLGFQSVGSQTGFQRWFLNNEYQKFSYFKNCIFFQMKIKSILQKKKNISSSSRSKEPSNSSNSFSEFKSFSINYTKLKVVYNQF